MYVNFTTLAKTELESSAKMRSHSPSDRGPLVQRDEVENLRSTNNGEKTGPGFLLPRKPKPEEVGQGRCTQDQIRDNVHSCTCV